MASATELLHLMIARVTGGGEVSKSAFETTRKVVLNDPTGRRFAPECVRICREPDATWSYVKSRDPELPTYESRRQFLREEFEPLLSALEQVEVAPLDDLVSKDVDRWVLHRLSVHGLRPLNVGLPIRREP
jgi:hypothetical protein